MNGNCIIFEKERNMDNEISSSISTAGYEKETGQWMLVTCANTFNNLGAIWVSVDGKGKFNLDMAFHMIKKGDWSRFMLVQYIQITFKWIKVQLSVLTSQWS